RHHRRGVFERFLRRPLVSLRGLRCCMSVFELSVRDSRDFFHTAPESQMSSGVVWCVTRTLMVGRTLRALLVGTLTLGAIALPIAAGTASAAAVEQQFAVVRLTIEQADGKVLRATQTVPWGQAATF